MKTKTNLLYFFSLITLIIILFISCNKDKDNNDDKSNNSNNQIQNCGTATDADGNVYNTVIIGNQCWMAKNLAYLPSVVGAQTNSYTLPYYYVYGYNGTSVSGAKATTDYNTYGVLYNWAAALSACPIGWHLPSDAEWTQLTTYLGGESVAGSKLKEAGTTHWVNPNTGATNETGFSALAGGRYAILSFDDQLSRGYWWSATEFDTLYAWNRHMTWQNSHVNRNYMFEKRFGFSVRCIKD